MKNKRTYIKYGVLVIMAIIIISIIPLIIDYLIGYNFPSNIDNSEWVSFLGSYIGALIGAIATIIGIRMTLKYTTEQTNEERRLAMVPYFKYIMNEKTLSKKDNHDIDNHDIEILQIIDEDSNTTVDATITLKNIGNGPTIDMKAYNISYEGKDIDSLIQRGDGILESKSELLMLIELKMKLDEISNDILIKNPPGSLLEYGLPDGYMNKEGLLSISIGYKDLIGNKYEQNIELFVAILVESKLNGLDKKYLPPILSISKIEDSQLL